MRLFDGVEIDALNVLDDRELEDLAVVELADDRRNDVQARQLRGPPATLAGNDLIGTRGAGIGAKDDRLDDAVFTDRAREILEFPVPERLPRLARIGSDQVDGDRRGCAGLGRLGPRHRLRIAEQRREAAAKAAPIGLAARSGVHAAAERPSRPRSSAASAR